MILIDLESSSKTRARAINTRPTSSTLGCATTRYRRPAAGTSQLAGRRSPAPKASPTCLIDHSGAVYRHGLLEDPVTWTLDVTNRAENQPHAICERRGVKRLLECPQCKALRQGGEPCPQCGFEPKRCPDAIVFAEGELAQVKKGKKAQATYSDGDR